MLLLFVHTAEARQLAIAEQSKCIQDCLLAEHALTAAEPRSTDATSAPKRHTGGCHKLYATCCCCIATCCVAVPAQVLQVSADGTTLFFPGGMPAREVAAYAQRFLGGVHLCSPAGLVAAAVDAANADAVDQTAGVEARPGLRAARTGYAAAAAARSPGREPGRGAPGGCINLRLFVKTLTGSTLPISVPQASTVAHIMRAVTDAEGVPPHQQRLLLCGKQLEMYSFLQDVGVENEATVHVVLRLAGC